jgi:hypothetical protein
MSSLSSRNHSNLLTWACLGTLALLGCGADKPPTAVFIAPSYMAPEPCLGVTCSGRGVCIPDKIALTAVCDCETGFGGERCETCGVGFHGDATGRCLPDRRCDDSPTDPCGNHGQCNDDQGVIACTCEQGYAGPRCTVCAPGYGTDDAGECLQKVLANGRSATLPAMCTVDVCGGHGQCSDLDGLIQCDCYPAYIGGRCESCADGYARPAGSDRCVVIAACDASSCGGCTPFDPDPDFPTHPDTCVSSHELQLDDMTIWSSGGEGTLWLCAGSSRYALSSEHVALEAGAKLPAEITFNSPVTKLSFDYAAWDALELAVLGDDQVVGMIRAAHYGNGSLSLSFDAPVRVLGLRSNDDYAHTIAIDNIVYESAMCQ